MAEAYIVDSNGHAAKLRSSLVEPREGHTATALLDGTVLIFGGTDGRGHYIRQMELYDPQSQQFKLVSGRPLMPRSGHTATILTDGRLLVIGGTGEGQSLPDDIQFWDFRTGTIETFHVQPKCPRENHSAILQAGGTVLISGGSNLQGQAIHESEIFDPATRSFALAPESGSHHSGGTRFAVEASIPADGAEAVPIDDFLKVRFSGLADIESINGQTIRLTDAVGRVVAATVSGAENGRLAFLIPTAPLMPGADYTLNFQGVKSTSGVEIESTSIGFHTASDVDDGTADGWIPDGDALAGNWVTGRTASSRWQNLPPLKAAPGLTALSRQVLGLSGRPIPHVTLEVGSLHVQTDNTGRFLISNLLPGRQVLTIDGRTADSRFATYGLYEVAVDVKAGLTNVLNYTIWMTRLDTAHVVRIPSPTSAADTVITSPLLPGLELHLPPNTTIVDHEGHRVTQLTITPIPLDKPPFPLPTGVKVPIYFTIQPGGSEIEVKSSTPGATGGRLYYPNTYNEPAGTVYNFWNYDATGKGWYIYGTGHVSADREHILPDAGVVVYELTGAMVGAAGAKPAVGGSGGPASGDPVDLASGEFVYTRTDHALPDVVPIGLTRTYISNDHYARPFGVGATDNYDMFMVGDSSSYSYQELILPRGRSIRFNRVSPGTGYTDAVYTSASAGGEFYAATLRWDTSTIPGASWILRTRFGTLYGFPEALGQNDQVHQALVGIRDRHGNLVTLTRDGGAHLTKITSPSGRYIELTNDASGRITQAVDNGGRTVSYTYDASGRLQTVTDVNGGVTAFAYNSNDQMTSITDPREIEYLQNQYDGNGRIKLQTQADGSTYSFQWTPSGNASQQWVTSGLPVNRYNPDDYEGYTGLISQVVVTDPRGYQRQIQFNNLGIPISDTSALGQPEQETTTTNYYSDNLPESVTDALGRTSKYDYDSQGNFTTLTLLSGTSNAVTYSATYDQTYGNPLTVTDPLNHTTTFTYNAGGSLVNTQDALGHGAILAYNSLGEVASLTDSVGNATQFGYSGGVLTSITDPLGNQTTMFPDQFGRVSIRTDARGNATHYQYDNENHVTSIVNAQGAQASLTYDPNGALLSVQDFLSHKTQYTYDLMDRMIVRTDPLNRTTTITYDLAGNPASVTDRKGQVTSRTFDGIGRQVFVGYGTTNSGSNPSYQSTISYQYDPGNRLSSTTDSQAGAITRTYDGLNGVLSETNPQGSISYTYDGAERRITAQAAGGVLMQYTYDNANRLTGIAQGSSNVTFAYDNANRRTTLTLPNGVTVHYGYDQDSRVHSISYTAAAGATIGNLTYTYDADGEKIGVGGTLANTNLPNPLGQATYDAANELTSWDGLTPVYDADGEMTTDLSGNQYIWNARNQLTAITGGMSAAFAYDAFGRRISKTVGPQTTTFQYDGLNRVAETSSGVTASLLPGALDEYFQRTDSSGTTVPLVSGLGSTIAITDASGALRTSYWYDPFGETTMSGTSSGNATQFAGRENDGTGLYYYRARYYDQEIGRFISEDPLGLQAGLNVYAYVMDNPLSYVDPLGLDRTPSPNSNPNPTPNPDPNPNPNPGPNPDPGPNPTCFYLDWGSSYLGGLSLFTAVQPEAAVGSVPIGGASLLGWGVGKVFFGC